MIRPSPESATESSVLSRLQRADVRQDPFPHIVSSEALDDVLCDHLIDQFPPLELITQGTSTKSNKRYNLSATDVLDDSRVSPLWREVVSTHVSQAFLDQALELFADPIRNAYPSFEQEFGPLQSLRAGVRRQQTFEDGVDVLLDAQISVNTPVTGETTSVRRGHVDAHNKLFVGLLYLRHPDDDSTGGELELYRYATDRPIFEGTSTWTAIDDGYLEFAERVPYQKNQLVFFLNTPDALHGVTPRSRTATPRLFMNLVAEVRRPLFDVPLASPPRPPLLARIRRSLRDSIRRS
jgi:hypothetical protein